ncbi:MAG: hypothetical protein HY815_05795 [Candidatus Riflebacteria bacterium]|nr:hypothetical protein [Candidatus Riflebacteria bacterium]
MLEALRRPLYVVALILWIQLLETTARLQRAELPSNLPTEILAIDQLAWSVRRAIANILWVRVDEYLHASDVFSVKGKKDDHGGHSGERVFGVSAKLSAQEVYPTARLVTILDPGFVSAGIVLGTIFLQHPKKREEASKLLMGLIRANVNHPRLYALYATLGVARWHQRDFRGAVPFLKRAHELYPRVLDPKALELAGEAPLDSWDNFANREVLTALVSCSVELGDYEAAFEYWKKCEGFNPKRHVVQVLIRYRQQKMAGAVNPAELRELLRKLDAQEQDEVRSFKRENVRATSELDPFKGGQDGKLAAKAQPTEFLSLGLPLRQALKMLVILGIIGGILIMNRRRRWLSR